MQVETSRDEAEKARAYLIRNVIVPLHPTCVPRPDLMGICTQVDNITAGLKAERDAATARAEAAEARCDLFDTQAAAAKVTAANAEAQRDAAIAERDALRDEWEEIAAGITTEHPEVGALWPLVSEVSGNLAAARNLFRNEVGAHNRTKAERDRMRAALEIVAGYRQCMDNLMSNVDVARVALTSAKEPSA